MGIFGCVSRRSCEYRGQLVATNANLTIHAFTPSYVSHCHRDAKGRKKKKREGKKGGKKFRRKCERTERTYIHGEIERLPPNVSRYIVSRTYVCARTCAY